MVTSPRSPVPAASGARAGFEANSSPHGDARRPRHLDGVHVHRTREADACRARAGGSLRARAAWLRGRRHPTSPTCSCATSLR
eukprot:2132555-Prymnesium_polylepis.1